MSIALFILLVSSGGYIFYLLSKLDNQRNRIFTLTMENDTLKKTSWKSRELRNISVEVLECPCVEGIVKYDTKLYFVPADWSPLLNNIKKSTKVRLLEKSRVNGRTWYYVELTTPKRLNSRGWLINEDVLSTEDIKLIT